VTTTTPPTRLGTTEASPASADCKSRGACLGEDTELFFPIARTRGWVSQTRAAKKVCARCPVRPECLQWALETGQRFGVWGGLSEKERKTRYQLSESQAERCWDNQQWIEQQVAKGTSQKDMASQLVVSRSVLCRVIRQFEAERSAGTVVEGVRAA
jgi:WhiB family redox-sensing transcriptional regulator